MSECGCMLRSLGVLTDSTNRNALTPLRAPPSASKTPPTSVLPKTPSSAFHSRSQVRYLTVKVLHWDVTVATMSLTEQATLLSAPRTYTPSLH